MSDDEFKQETEHWQRYYDQGKDIDQLAFEIGDRYDKLALAVSGGGFIVSITFLEKSFLLLRLGLVGFSSFRGFVSSAV